MPFDEHTEIGVLGPRKHLLNLQPYLNRNEGTVRGVAPRMGAKVDLDSESDTFFAGKAFIARTTALLSLGTPRLAMADFEP